MPSEPETADGPGTDHPMRQSWCLKAEFGGETWYSTRYYDEDRVRERASELRQTDGVTEVEVCDL